MGSLATNFSAFLFLFPLGIRRLLCSFSFYLKSPSLYRAKTWYFTEPKWKNFDLYILLITLPIAAFSEIFWFLTFRGNPARFSFFQQAVVILLFWVFIVVVILRENFDLFIIHENVMFLLAGTAFLVEYSVMGGGSSVLAGRCYELLAALTLICAASSFLLSFQPFAFFADVALSAGLVFKGTWILQVGLSLFSTAFLPKGCHKLSVLPSNNNGEVQCDLEEDSLRGVALINLLFVGHTIGILILSFVLFGVLFSNRNLRHGAGASSNVEFESEAMLMHPLPSFEIE